MPPKKQAQNKRKASKSPEAPGKKTNKNVKTTTKAKQTASTGGPSKSTIATDRFIKEREDHYVVKSDGTDYYSYLNQINADTNTYKFYINQVVYNTKDKKYYLFNRWGRIGYPGQNQISKPFDDLQAAIKEYNKKVKSKSSGGYIAADANEDAQKGKLVQVPFVSDYKVCLGWQSTCDVDTSILMFDDKYKIVDSVSFMQLRSKDRAVKHAGDDTVGKNKNEDNENIGIDMSKLNPKVKTLWVIANVFSWEQSFTEVKGAYCSVEDKKGKALIKLDLTSNCYDKISNGCIMCKMTVEKDKTLSIMPKGLYTKDTRTCDALEEIIQKLELKDDYKLITIRESYFKR